MRYQLWVKELQHPEKQPYTVLNPYDDINHIHQTAACSNQYRVDGKQVFHYWVEEEHQ